MSTIEALTVAGVCDNNSYANKLLEESSHDQLDSSISTLQNDTHTIENTLQYNNSEKPGLHKLNSAVWTTHATSVLLKLYEDKLEMLETPKKKTRIWIAISESLKNCNIDVSPDQVRWKINALTKKYKHCIDMGKHEKFKYFKEMDSIYSKYNVDCDTYSITEFLSKNKSSQLRNDSAPTKFPPETRAVIEMRKIRLANRIDSDRFQGKIKLERQWIDYLRKQEEQKQWSDEVFERKLKLKEEELEIRKQELELKESLDYRKLQQMEKEQHEFLQVKREKCKLLKQIFQRSLLKF